MLLPGLAAPGIILVKMFSRWKRVWNDAPGARAEARKMALGTVRDWLPLVLVATVFDNLEDYTGIIRKVPIDDWLGQALLLKTKVELAASNIRQGPPLAGARVTTTTARHRRARRAARRPSASPSGCGRCRASAGRPTRCRCGDSRAAATRKAARPRPLI